MRTAHAPTYFPVHDTSPPADQIITTHDSKELIERFRAVLQNQRDARDTAAAEDEVHAPGHTHTPMLYTRHATQTQPASLSADAFAMALGAIPQDDWCRTWAASRTIMLRRTSKRVKEAVDKMCLPAVVRLSRSLWGDTRNDTAAEKLQFVLRQLTSLTDRCRISTLELPLCEMQGQNVERLAGVLGHCAELTHINLSYNGLGADGTGRLAGVLGQCAALAHLDLSNNNVRAAGTASLAGVLGQCAGLAHLNLSNNMIYDAGAESLAGVLAQCAGLAHLNLCNNMIYDAGAQSLARVLAQCAALAHLNLCNNMINKAGAESLAGVLAQCPALAHLDLRGNMIGTAGGGRIRASWSGQVCGLLL
jgi:Ran GTPase-activating protein (RanGAP) involved in mRNA processing and transport